MSDKLKFQPLLTGSATEAGTNKQKLTSREKLVRRAAPLALLGVLATGGAIKIAVSGGDSRPQKVDVNSYSPEGNKSEARFLERVAAGLEKAKAANGIDVLYEGVRLRSAPKVVNERDGIKGNLVDTVKPGQIFMVTNPLIHETIEDNDGHRWHGAVLQVDDGDDATNPTELAGQMVWYDATEYDGLNRNGSPYIAHYNHIASEYAPEPDEFDVAVSDKGQLSLVGTTDTQVLAQGFEFGNQATLDQFLDRGYELAHK